MNFFRTATTAAPSSSPTDFNCATQGCDDQFVCDVSSGECMRNCDVFHIDDFLLDCSAEWGTSAADQASMRSEIDGIQSSISEIEKTLNQMAFADARAAGSAVDEFGFTGKAQDHWWTAFNLGGKDVVIIILLAITAIMLTIILTLVCTQRTCGKSIYQKVRVYEDSGKENGTEEERIFS